MKTLTSYYRETMRFLAIAGEEYSDAHPDTARYLNRDNLETAWPGFEDILRGLGFLGARIHALLDHTRNDFYADLVHLFWPQLAQDIPSVCLMNFTAKKHHLTKSYIIPRGTLVSSDVIGEKDSSCTFSITQDVRVSPLTLAGIDKKNTGLNSGELTLRFALKEGLDWKDLTLDPLRIHLWGELPVAIALHELMTRHITRAQFIVGEDGNRDIIERDTDAVTPGGMGPGETLLPPVRNGNFAFSFLTEYFVFREKFLCFDLHGLDSAAFKNNRKTPSCFSVTFSFDCGLPKDKPFNVENFRLFCTPAINLFQRSIEPVTATLTYDEYPLCADNTPGASAVTHSIISVTGYNRSTGTRVEYAPMTAFSALQTGSPTWLVRYQTDIGQRHRETLLYLGGRKPAEGAPPDGENISIEAWCSNGDLPHGELRENDLAECRTLPLSGISVTNLTRPTERAFPRDEAPLAILATLLGANYEELTSADTFSAFLKAYDRSGNEGNRRRTESILKVERTKTQAFYKNTLLSGLCYTLTIDEKTFSDLNDLHLFGQMLAVFLSCWSRMEIFTELLFVCKPSGHTLSWSSLEPWIRSIDGVAPAPADHSDSSTPFASPSADEPGVIAPVITSSPVRMEADLETLMQKIEREAGALNFFGTIGLLEGYFTARGTPDPFKANNLLLVPDTSLSFPSSDIAAVERHGDHFLVRCAFLGLTGASSPLPVQWSRTVIEKPETASALLALLTLFNRRFYELFYEANKKYRLNPLPGRYEQDALVRRIAALGGMVPQHRYSAGDWQSLSSISLFAASPRSATGLAAMLSSCMGNIPVSIKRFMPHSDTVPQAQQTQLCRQNCTLGADAILGNRIDNRAGKFRITFGPLKRSVFEGILSGRHRNRLLGNFIDSYVNNTLDYDLELLIRFGDLPPAALGGGENTGTRLGVNAGLGTPALPMETNSVVIEGRSLGENNDTRPGEGIRTKGSIPQESGGTIDKYFEEDIRTLYESARSFSTSFPRAGKELGITSTGASDPVVSRLFQGAAFHSAHIRESLGDTLPELSERLFNSEWPEFLYALPSATIVEFTPLKGSVSQTQVLPRGTELLSKTLSHSGGRISFTTSQSVALNPITLTPVDFNTDRKGKGRITLRLDFEKGISWAGINLDPLRLYLHGEEKTAFSLHRMLLHELEKVSIRYDNGGPGREIEFADGVMFPFCGPEYRLLHPHSFKSTGYASLIEYFAFRQKFLFIDLHGFHDERFSVPETAPRSCTITIFFKNDFPRGLSLGNNIFRLFCSPAVNIFKRNAALKPTGIKKDDYTVVAPADAPATLIPHSVLTVSGPDKAGDDSREYLQKSGPAAFGRSPEKGTWESRFRQRYDGRQSIRLELDHGKGKNPLQSLSDITVSAIFSNGTQPHTELSIGEIAFHATGFPDRIDFANITRPTLPNLPPGGENQWLFMALAGATPAIPSNAASMKQLLKLFDWTGEAGKNSTCNAITDFYATAVKSVSGRGEILRGTEYTLALDESLMRRDDRHLFGQVLCEFLQSKTLATSFVSLVIMAQPSGTILKWEGKPGLFGVTK